ncbi:MAG: prephenate dehydratase, partial [Pseudomonadota bacterium]
MSTETDLEQLRGEIDNVDRELLRLINLRASIAIEVGKVKRAMDSAPKFYRAEREAQILRAHAENNPGPLPDAEAARILREIMSACLALEHPLNVAYLGPDGTYTHLAVLKHFGGSVKQMPLASISDIVEAVEVSRADFGIVPLENSLEGSVNQTMDALVDSTLKIHGEVYVEIEHQLLSLATNAQEIEVVHAHPQALAQCRRWLDQNLPNAKRATAPSNAEGARIAAEQKNAAAIASRRAAELYGLNILRSNIEDAPDNTTRFVVLGKLSPPPSGEDITSFVFTTPNRPGALHDVL